MNSRIYLVILFVVLSCRLSCTNAEFRIFNGIYITIQDSPHSVSIFIKGKYRCVGSLVNWNSVVTVANCVYRYRSCSSSVDVLAGTMDIGHFNTANGQQRTAQHIIPHHSFTSGSRDADIAVVKVHGYFERSKTVNTVHLCRSKLKPDRAMTVSGWGAETLSGMDSSIILKTTTMSIIRQNECQNYIDTLPGPALRLNTIICAEGGTSHMGSGDEGAGATVNNELCAVVQSGCDRLNTPTLFTDVTNSIVLCFVRANIK